MAITCALDEEYVEKGFFATFGGWIEPGHIGF